MFLIELTYLRCVESNTAILKLSELSAIVAGIFQMHFSGERFWVTAEVTGLKISRGHCYLQLAEKDDNGATPKAEFRGIIWASAFSRIQPRFTKATGHALKEQMQVLLQVEVQYHERYGMSLIVHDLDESFTLGQLEMERRLTIEKLKKEGVYEHNKNLHLPGSLQHLAVISAEDSKGYEDFFTRLNNNVYGYTFHCTLYTSLLQGDLAAGDIISKLNHIKIDHPTKHFDAVIIVRGGGSASSLECFNNYLLAKSIAVFPLPIITGIGHQADKSIVDEVAHTDRMTPTDVAGFLIEHQGSLEAELDESWSGIRSLASEVLEQETDFIESAISLLQQNTNLDLSRANRSLDQLAFSFRHLWQGLLMQEQNYISNFAASFRKEIQQFINIEKEYCIQQKLNLSVQVKHHLKSEDQVLENKEALLRILDPQEVLKRGYSYTLHRGKILSATDDLQSGDELTTHLYKGEITSIVKEKK